MEHPARRVERCLPAAGLAALLAVLAPVGCADHSTAPDAEPFEIPPISAIISNPIANAAAGQATGTVYVSMPPGTVAVGEHVQIRNASTGFSTTTVLIDGGFDPLAVPASVGQMLIVAVLHNTRVTARSELVVEPRRPPTLVRTSPAAKKRDVPLNAVIVLVFSEPMDPATLTATSVRLVREGADVPGTLSVSHPVALTAEFRPSAPLIPETDYTLVVSGAVSDLDGDELGTPVIVDFTTQALLLSPTHAIGKVGGDNQSDTVRATLADPLLVRVVRDGDVPVAGVAVRWTEIDGEASGTFIESGSATATTLTGNDGFASVRLALGERAGRVLVQATVPGMTHAEPLWFNASARAGNVVSLVIDSTRTFNNVGLVGLTGVSLSPFHVLAADAHGNDVDARVLEWSVVSGTGVVTPVPGSSSAIATPLADGLLVVSAAAPGVTPVTFDGHGVAATILTVGGTDGHCEEGDFIPRTVEVTQHRWVAWTICWNDSNEDGWSLVGGEWHWGYEHDVTFEDGVVTWPSTAGPRANYRPHFRVFTAPGTYRFRCTRHSSGFDPDDGETGAVIVR